MGGIRIGNPGRLREATAGRRSADLSGETLGRGLQQFAQNASQVAATNDRIQQNVSRMYVMKAEPRIALEMEQRLEELRLGMTDESIPEFTATVARELEAKLETELRNAPQLAQSELSQRFGRIATQTTLRAMRYESQAMVDFITRSTQESDDTRANFLLSRPDDYQYHLQRSLEDIDALEQPDSLKEELRRRSQNTLAEGSVRGLIAGESMLAPDGQIMTDEDGKPLAGPERALYELEEENTWRTELTDDQYQGLLSAARAEVARRQRARDTAAKADLTLIRDQLRNWKDTTFDGTENAILSDADVLAYASLAGPEWVQEYSQYLEMAPMLRGFRGQSLDAMRQTRDQLLAQTANQPTTSEQRAAITAMNGMIEEQERFAREAPLTGLVNGGVLAAVPPLDPIPTADQIEARVQAARQAEAYYGQSGIGWLEPGEASRISRALMDMAPDDAVRGMQELLSAVPERLINGTASQLFDENELEMATAMALVNEDPRVAERIIRGTSLVESDGFNLKDNDFDSKIPSSYQFLFTDRPKLRDAIIPAAKAIYATMMPADKLGPDGSVDPTAWRRAMDEVTGGIVNMNGAPTIAPRRGISQGDFLDLLGRIEPGDLTRFGRSMQDDGTLSILGDGGIPRGAGGDPLTPGKFMDHATLEPAADGVYYVLLGGQYVQGREGQPYLLDLSAVADEYGIAPRAPTPAIDRLRDASLQGL